MQCWPIPFIRLKSSNVTLELRKVVRRRRVVDETSRVERS